MGYLYGCVGGWLYMFCFNVKIGENFYVMLVKIVIMLYYDMVNFVKCVKVFGYYMWGYNDEVCLLILIYVVFNQINVFKEFVLVFEVNYLIIFEQIEVVVKWIGGFLKLVK